MPFDNYQNLQATILTWLARPADPLVLGSVPDMIALFEAEARRRLFNRLGETQTTLTLAAGTASYALPPFYAEFRTVRIPATSGAPQGQGVEGVRLTYLTPEEIDASDISIGTGIPRGFTIEGSTIRFAPTPDYAYGVDFGYIAAIPGLGSSAALPDSGGSQIPDSVGGSVPSTGGAIASNWLLANHPDVYLFGSLVEAEMFIGNDERMPAWKQKREETFASIDLADRKARWSGSVLVMRTDTGNP